MGWLDMYCSYCTPTGWSTNNPIVHGLARHVLYSLYIVKGAAWLLLLSSIYMWLCIIYITRELAMAGSLDLYHHLITELHQ
jgi:hypothetical protein